MNKFSWKRAWPMYCTCAIGFLLGCGVTMLALALHWPTVMYPVVWCAGGMVSACIGVDLIWLQEHLEARASR